MKSLIRRLHKTVEENKELVNLGRDHEIKEGWDW